MLQYSDLRIRQFIDDGLLSLEEVKEIGAAVYARYPSLEDIEKSLSEPEPDPPEWEISSWNMDEQLTTLDESE